MNRRQFFAASGITAAALPLSINSFASENGEKPNVIYLMLDEWGYYEWSAMGHPIIQTPNIDRIASEGIRFTGFLAGSSVCAPTRSSLLTGQHTGHTTIRSNGGGTALCPDDITIADVMKEAGYATGGFGKWGLGDAGTTGVPEKHGFDTFFGYYHQVHAHSYYPRYLLRNSEKVKLEGNSGDLRKGEVFSHYLIHEEGMKFIRENRDRPFFAYLPWTPPHGLWGMPEEDPAWQKYKDKKWDAGNQGDKRDAQFYAAMLEMVDRQVGDLLDLLKELDLDRKTIIFVCGDNGGQDYFKNEEHPHGFLAPNLDPRTGKRFRGGKRSFYEGGLRIPFMARWPGHISPGQVSDHLGYFPDIMPTLAELAGVESPSCSDGISIVPALLGEEEAGRKQARHDYLYWEDDKSCAVRARDWKAVKPAGASDFELYNLGDDMEELQNLSSKYPEVLGKMKKFAGEAHRDPCLGQVLDPSLGFKGHKAP